MKTKSEIDRITKTFEHLIKNSPGFEEYDFTIDIEYQYYGTDVKKLGEYMLTVDFIADGADPDIDMMYRYIKSADNLIIEFLGKFSFDENVRIVSTKQHPDKKFSEYISGSLCPNINYSFSDEILTFSIHVMVESIPLDERENQ